MDTSHSIIVNISNCSSDFNRILLCNHYQPLMLHKHFYTIHIKESLNVQHCNDQNVVFIGMIEIIKMLLIFFIIPVDTEGLIE
jgi:hypothetical protein